MERFWKKVTTCFTIEEERRELIALNDSKIVWDHKMPVELTVKS